RDFSEIKRVVVKVGSSSLVNADNSINFQRIDELMQTFIKLKKNNIEIALVSSGAIALGMYQLGLSKKPKEMALKQACAAIGQAKLMQCYNDSASKYGLICGQILLNHDDFQVRKRMLYLCDTLDAMFKNNIIPIINENDALAVEEIKVGDNDTLASLIVPMIKANLLVLFSDIDGLFNKNPKLHSDAFIIKTVDKIDNNVLSMVGDSTSNVGTGGMKTKINAAIIATTACCNMIICNSQEISRLDDIIKGEEIGTLFTAKKKGISSREHWMIFKANSSGNIIVDDGCKDMLLKKKVSILPKGVVSVNGEFLQGAVIDICDKNNKIIAKGITNYSYLDILRIKGLSTMEVKQLISSDAKSEIIHANNMVVFREDLLC
ncbi:TPA: glutamate 5-kinase, partial [Candidatus Avacholeplasma faecigallinarum]|nr:glutamate 5-kinase [Candidatus Avacholeplasma faecigallinarum]